jgi:hypothetical protein
MTAPIPDPESKGGEEKAAQEDDGGHDHHHGYHRGDPAVIRAHGCAHNDDAQHTKPKAAGGRQMKATVKGEGHVRTKLTALYLRFHPWAPVSESVTKLMSIFDSAREERNQTRG